MTASDNAFQLITHFEGFSAKAYQDPVGIWTIGYGTIRVNGKPVTQGMTCTTTEAKQWMMEELNEITPRILNVCKVTLQQHELDALVSFVYNLGIGSFQKSTLLKKINAQEPIIAKYFTDWNKARVNSILTPLAGLTRRREAEFHLYTQGFVKVYFT